MVHWALGQVWGYLSSPKAWASSGWKASGQLPVGVVGVEEGRGYACPQGAPGRGLETGQEGGMWVGGMAVSILWVGCLSYPDRAESVTVWLHAISQLAPGLKALILLF